MKVFPLAAIVALLLVAASAQSCPAPGGIECFDEGLCMAFSDGSNLCACASGQYGADCSTPAPSSCTFNSVDALETANIPLSVIADYTNDELTIVLTSPLVGERTSTSIMIDESSGNDANCTYPGNYWSRTVDQCLDEFTGVMPWLDTRGCGWEYDDTDAEYYIYRATMIVEHHDLTDPFAGRAGSSPLDRLTTHMVPLEVLFQKYVDVSTNISVSSPISILAAITKQTIDPETKLGVIEVTTSALHPYYLDAEALSLTPNEPGFTYSISEISGECLNDPNEFCLQVFRIEIDASAGCEITGDYQINVAVDCWSNSDTSLPWESCVVEDDASADINLVILSEDFCAKVSASVDITGSLSSYQDDLYSLPKSNFLNDQVVYFSADIASPDATLTAAEIQSVKLVSGAEEITLYLSGSTPIADAAFGLDGGSVDSALFFFTLKESYITGIAIDATKDYQVVARVDVTFEGVPGVKRMIASSAIDNRQFAVAQQIGVEATELDVVQRDSSAVALSFVCSLVGLPFLLAF